MQQAEEPTECSFGFFNSVSVWWIHDIDDSMGFSIVLGMEKRKKLWVLVFIHVCMCVCVCVCVCVCTHDMLFTAMQALSYVHEHCTSTVLTFHHYSRFNISSKKTDQLCCHTLRTIHKTTHHFSLHVLPSNTISLIKQTSFKRCSKIVIYYWLKKQNKPTQKKCQCRHLKTTGTDWRH